jgi:predicted transcriptional regulator YdeE
MKTEKEILSAFPLIGITVRTSNAEGHAANDIPELWTRFWASNVAAQLPGRVGDNIYSVYTEYEGDYTQPYTTLIGYRVENLDHIPDGFTGLMIEGGPYLKYTVKGNLLQGAVFNAWQEIWKTDIPRAYTTDFEIYGSGAQNPLDAEVDIYLAVKF